MEPLTPTGEHPTLFDVTTIPSRQVTEPTLAVQGNRWCKGSGVPGDNCEMGHPVDPEWASIAWRPSEDGRDVPRPICHRCETTRRNWLDSLEDGMRAKGRAWLNTKAGKYAKLWHCTPAEARHKFNLHGVTTDYITQLFADANARGTCPDWKHGGCGLNFDGKSHDITGDIKDPAAVKARGYLLPDDIHAQCSTCNKSKGSRTWTAWLRICAFFHFCEQWNPPGQQHHLA